MLGNIVPTLKSVKKNSEKSFRINHIALKDCPLSPDVTKDFLDFCKLPDGECNVLFQKNESLDKEEYAIKTGEVIIIEYSDIPGAVYALQTLKQMLFFCKNEIPDVTINDEPEFPLRGFMIDVGRYFFPTDDIKLFIRKMAMHKLNLMHFHLTEDQGWRVQIDKYPLLTEIGSHRSHTNFNHKPHDGYYTKTEIKDIVEYAHAFGIKVMPEFDIPGHCTSAIAAYNHLTCFPRKTEVATHWGVKLDTLCPGKDSTYEFVFDVIDELCELFPDEYFHIGGDEVPKHRWDLCPDCRKKVEETGVKNSDELQYIFMNKINDYLKEKGKTVYMWGFDLKENKILDESLNFTLCQGNETVSGNRKYIDSSTKAYYIDLPYGYISLKDTTEHRIDDENCLGVEATLWTEYVPDMKKADKMTFPRLGAMSETGWYGQTSYALFSEKLDGYYSLLHENGWGYSKPETAMPNKLRGNAQIALFERRQLTWEALTNFRKRLEVEKMAKNNK